MKRIGITLGDPAGIGPEVILKSLSQIRSSEVEFIVYGNKDIIKKTLSFLNCSLIVSNENIIHESYQQPVAKIKDCHSLKAIDISSPNKETAWASFKYLEIATEDCINKHIDALVTGPVHKSWISSLGQPFHGHNYYFAKKFVCHPVMAFVGDYFNLGLVTHHIPLKDVSRKLSIDEMVHVFKMFWDFHHQLGKYNFKIAVCGLNPHAGENGLLGTEEVIIQEAILQSNLNLVGPISADTAFYHAYRNKYQGVIAMYHDQGLAPFKLLHFDNGVQVSLNLPVVRTSPDHGTAYDIFGRGCANEESMKKSILLAAQLLESSHHLVLENIFKYFNLCLQKKV